MPNDKKYPTRPEARWADERSFDLVDGAADDAAPAAHEGFSRLVADLGLEGIDPDDPVIAGALAALEEDEVIVIIGDEVPINALLELIDDDGDEEDDETDEEELVGGKKPPHLCTVKGDMIAPRNDPDKK